MCGATSASSENTATLNSLNGPIAQYLSRKELPSLITFPLTVAVTCAAFATIVMRQYVNRRRPHQLTWAISLTLGFSASAFYIMFADSIAPIATFKLYYVCGGLLMAAYLGLGSLFLLLPRKVASAVATVVVATSVLGVILIFQAQTDPVKLAHAADTFGPGTDALRAGPWKAAVAGLNTFGALAVTGGAIYSAYLTAKRNAPIRFLWANILIAAGTFLAALAGTAADQGTFAGEFWLVLAIGFVVLFSGFVMTTTIPFPKGARERQESVGSTE